MVWFALQMAGKLIMAGQNKYMNNTNYLIKSKTLYYYKALQIALKMNKTQKLSDLRPQGPATTETARLCNHRPLSRDNHYFNESHIFWAKIFHANFLNIT